MTTELPTVSASKIKVFKTCPKQYNYKYVLAHNDRPADDKNVAALLGTALHEAIELKYKDDSNPTATFQQVMNDTLDQWEKDKLKINAASYYTQAMKIGKDILNKFRWDQFKPTELEYKFLLPFPNAEHPIAMVNGYIDLIDRDKKTVIDFKSSSYAPVQDELNHDPQFILYAWAYEQIYGEKPNHVYWYHLRTDKVYEFSQDNYYDKIMQLTYDMIAMFENTYYQRRLMDNVCKTKCSFYELCYGAKAKDGVLSPD